MPTDQKASICRLDRQFHQISLEASAAGGRDSQAARSPSPSSPLLSSPPSLAPSQLLRATREPDGEECLDAGEPSLGVRGRAFGGGGEEGSARGGLLDDRLVDEALKRLRPVVLVARAQSPLLLSPWERGS